MKLLACAFLTLAGEPSFLDASLYFREQLLDARFLDVDGDGVVEVLLAVRDRERKERELRLHRFDAEGRVVPKPERVYPMLDDVFAWTVADVRADPGRELCLLTPGGAFSLTTTREGLRGNAERLVRQDLFYTVPDGRALPYWPYVLRGEERDRLLLPTPDALAVFAPAPALAETSADDPTAPAYRLDAAIAASATGSSDRDDATADDKVAVRTGRVNISFTSLGGRGFLLSDTDRLRGDVYDVSGSLLAPALADLDGDGRNDLVVLRDGALDLHIARRDGSVAAEPTRREILPAALVGDHASEAWELADLDGDGDEDLLLLVEEEGGEAFDNHEWRLYVYVSDGARLLGEQPTQLMRFRGSRVSIRLADLDGDERADLIVREIVLPGGLATATGFRFTLNTLAFRGVPDGFETRAFMKQGREYDEASIQGAIAQRVIERDLSGDGIADMVEVDLRGRIAVHRILREKRLFGGSGWSLEEAPWKRFDVRGQILGLRVEDVNADGLGDVISVAEDRLVLLVSRSGGGR